MLLTVHPAESLTGNLPIPGDKSISHRAAILAALAEGESRIEGWLPAGDCQATLDALRALGVPVDVLSQTRTRADLRIRGVGLRGFRDPGAPLDCRGSGTTMRLLAGVLAGQPMTVTLDGHSGLRRRPMERIARPLRRMGADIETTDGRPPLRVRGGPLTGVDWTLPVPSGQVKSAILLAGLFAAGETIVRQPGPARDHTERMLRAQGVSLSVAGNVIRLQPPSAPLRPLRFTVPGDFSSAAFPLAAALLVPNSRLRLEGVNVNDTRTGLLDVLRAMGASVSLLDRREQAGEPLADLFVESASALRGTEIGGDTVVRMIDEFPILAVIATQARGVTVVRDAAELRVKETDRIKSAVLELRKMGAHLIPHPDGFEVHGPTPLRGAEVDSCGDHRLAMALAVAGLVADGPTTVHNAGVIGDSFPGFVDTLRQAGAKVEVRRG